jgi:MerR family transcriptional regulator, copper efflux regulator
MLSRLISRSLEEARMNATISIGALAQQTGCAVPTIRYYEEIGLLPVGPRTQAGRRLYGAAAVRRLTFIRRCRDFGFSIEQVRELMGLMDEPDRPCAEVRKIASGHLVEVRKKLVELQALEAGLKAFVLSCDTACSGGRSVDCTILDELAQPPAPPHRPPASACCGPSAKAEQ